MDAGHDGTSRRAAPGASSSRACQALWAVLLFGAIASAGLKVLPGPAGRAVLWLIGAGFLLFAIARGSMEATASPPSFCAYLLSPRMRRLYWSGYALMAAGVIVAALSAGVRLLR